MFVTLSNKFIIYTICLFLLKPDKNVCDYSLVIRGDKDERAVLCGGGKTYDLKIADTSNLLLFVPKCKTSDQITDSQDSAHVTHTQV